MLSFVRKCKAITDDRMHHVLVALFVLMALAATTSEALAIKRAGFVGMRGKKDVDYHYLFEDPAEFHKRSGFVGMRGKKAEADEAAQELEDLSNIYKRASSAFVGMRGKKAADSEGLDYFWPSFFSFQNQMPRASRAGSSGFVGMRG